MRQRRQTPPFNSSRRSQTIGAKDAQNTASKAVRHQDPEAPDEPRVVPDVALDGGTTAEPAQPRQETPSQTTTDVEGNSDQPADVPTGINTPEVQTDIAPDTDAKTRVEQGTGAEQTT